MTRLALLLLGFALFGCTGIAGNFCSFLGAAEQDRCYIQAAIDSGDASLCERMTVRSSSNSSQATRDLCYARIAESTGEYALCEKINGGRATQIGKECLEDSVNSRLVWWDEKLAGGNSLTRGEMAKLEEDIAVAKASGGNITVLNRVWERAVRGVKEK